MVFIDIQHREVTLKLVYYGPALSGKTTNLQQIHAQLPHHTCGEMVSLDTQNDRTLYFDFLPIEFATGGGFSIKMKFFTVPGQVMHKSTRRVVLAGADAICFVADSQRSSASAPDLGNIFSVTNVTESAAKLNGSLEGTGGAAVTFNIHWGDNDGDVTAANVLDDYFDAFNDSYAASRRHHKLDATTPAMRRLREQRSE